MQRAARNLRAVSSALGSLEHHQRRRAGYRPPSREQGASDPAWASQELADVRIAGVLSRSATAGCYRARPGAKECRLRADAGGTRPLTELPQLRRAIVRLTVFAFLGGCWWGVLGAWLASAGLP
jgi:hypothetical protein